VIEEYILERTQNTTRHFRFGNIPVIEEDPIPDNIDVYSIFKSVEKNLPPHYFDGVESVVINHLPEFDKRGVNAVYRDNKFYISNQQDDANDLLDDIIHEFAHHLETQYPELIYEDRQLIEEFRKKRNQMKFEFQSEGYWVNEYDFNDIKFNQSFDVFLYKRVGKNMLRLATTGIFIRPYGAVSLREYFATGFEAYYLGNKEALHKISPYLYQKIEQLHNLNNSRK
jgi:hypothetical protein